MNFSILDLPLQVTTRVIERLFYRDEVNFQMGVYKKLDTLEDLVQFNSVTSFRKDGARIIAKRIAIDTSTPIRWTIYLENKDGQVLEIPTLQQYEGRQWKQYSTHQLSQLTYEAGFTRWEQLARGDLSGIKLFEGKEIPVTVRYYDEPDTTPYPID